MILPILQYGDPILRAKGKRIEEIDDRIRDLAASMIETMHAAHGIGLAAQQIAKLCSSLCSIFRSRRPAKHTEVKWQRHHRSKDGDAAGIDQSGNRATR